MVDVSAKEDSDRFARAGGSIVMRSETLAAILRNEVAKGDVLSVAKVAGVMAAKRTSESHPLVSPAAIDQH